MPESNFHFSLPVAASSAITFCDGRVGVERAADDERIGLDAALFAGVEASRPLADGCTLARLICVSRE